MGFILRVYDWNLFHYVCSKLSFSSLHVSIRFVLFKLHINIYITISKKGLWWQLSCWCKKMISKQIFCSKKEFIKREELKKKLERENELRNVLVLSWKIMFKMIES